MRNLFIGVRPAVAIKRTLTLIATCCIGHAGCTTPTSMDGMGDPSTGGDVTPTGELADSFSVIYGPRATEDLAFDHDGYLLGAQDGNIFRTAYEGEPELVVANAGGSGGMRLITGIMSLPNGDIIYCDSDSGTLFRANASGTKEAILSGMGYPNGLEMDLNGLVYIAENKTNRVRRVNLETKEATILVSNVPSPDGVAFNPDYTTLYICSATMSNASSGTVYAVDIDADGQPGELRALASGFPAHLNAMAVDVDGNIYIAAVMAGEIWRLTPNGQERTLLVKVGDTLATVQWGSGLGGWDSKTLYISDRQNQDLVYALAIGVEGKPRLYP